MVEFRDGWMSVDSDIPNGNYYTIEEYADMYDVPESSIRTWINRGQVPAVHCYGRTYIPENAVVNYVWPWMKRRTALRRGVSQRG